MNAPTTYIQRFGDAMALLCGGKRPPEAMLVAWLDPMADSHDLQEFAVEHGPSWCQGIVLIDAARVLADTPAEGEDHEEEPDMLPDWSEELEPSPRALDRFIFEHEPSGDTSWRPMLAQVLREARRR